MLSSACALRLPAFVTLRWHGDKCKERRDNFKCSGSVGGSLKDFSPSLQTADLSLQFYNFDTGVCTYMYRLLSMVHRQAALSVCIEIKMIMTEFLSHECCHVVVYFSQ